MTYLELVNKVLVKLREDEVSTVNQDSYSKLIGSFVNDAKEFVESAWDWSQLTGFSRYTSAAPTVTLTDVRDNSKISHFKVGENFLEKRSRAWLDSQEPKTGDPEYYVYTGSTTDGTLTVQVYPTPDNLPFNLDVYFTNVRGELENDVDTIKIPHAPVVHFALAFAARERGENGGTTTQEYFAIANRVLSDAVAYDAGRNPEKAIWYTV